ncbi:YbhB/YbcL family Raf kinase inhibitor-like protein [Chloroflexota bacterium]
MKITSPAFREDEAIPVRYSCDGEDISPGLNWSGVPEGTQSFALINDDPDSPRGSTHWVIFNIPADSRRLAEAVPTELQLASGALQGKNCFGNSGYGGPCPPRDVLHHYHFTLYALDQPLNLAAGATKEQLLNAMQGHTLANAKLKGTFEH